MGPLDPEKDNLVCLSRGKDVNRVIKGILRGGYWAVVGPQRIGKTTFLRQVKHLYPNAYYIYVNFEENRMQRNDFYPWLTAEFLKEISPGENQKKNFPGGFQYESPELKFYEFLKTFTPGDKRKKVILLFDEIDRLSFCYDFLRLWRKVYHERYKKQDLKRYAVIVTGTVDMIELNLGPGSPFNIAELYYIRDFSDDESEQLIDKPLEKQGIKIEPEAKGKLVSHIAGHPQMLQHACHILVDKAAAPEIYTAIDNDAETHLETNENKQKFLRGSRAPRRGEPKKATYFEPNAIRHEECAMLSSPGRRRHTLIKLKDVNDAIDILFSDNLSLDMLKKQVLANEELKNLVRDLLNGEKKKFYPYQKFIISGAGPIIERDSYCAIRNKVYEQFLAKLLARQESITFKNTLIKEVNP
jgi:hypothetical protein